jgi:P27 family predicted phage terminase small subunit
MAGRGPKRRTGRNTAQPASGPVSVSPPSHLSGPEAEEFRRVASKLEAVGLLGKADVRTIEAVARCQVMIERASVELGSAPSLTETAANGTLMPHPMLGVIRQQVEQQNRLMGTLGLTPASSKLQTKSEDAGKADDPWAGLGLGVAG